MHIKTMPLSAICCTQGRFVDNKLLILLLLLCSCVLLEA